MKYFVTEKISKNMRKTPEGFLVCIGVPIARTGIQEYSPNEVPIEAEDGQSVKIQRDEKEVFRPETIASFEGKPFTLGHPEDMVDPENWRDLAKGTIQNVRRGEGEFNTSLIADIMITDAEAIAEVERGFREVSCGYEAEYLETGIGTGKQINIVGNHLALVPEGRAGGDYAIKDHKGVNNMKLSERISKIFDGAKKDALKAAATNDKGMEVISDEEADDAAPPWADKLGASIDKMADAINKQTSTQSQPTKQGDEDPEKEKEEKAKDADPMAAMMDAIKAIGDRLDAMEGKASDEEADDEEMGDDPADGDSDMSEDEEADDEEMDDEESESMVGDAKSRIEILAPGKKFAGKDAKAKALEVAYATKDGKAVIEVLTGGKKPNLKSVKTVDHLFKAASEVLKIKRQRSFAHTKKLHITKDGHADASEAPTIEEINAKNAKHFAEQQRSH